MNRWGCGILAVIGSLCLATGLRAQEESSRAAAIADRNSAEERYRLLSSAVEGVLAAQAEQQRRLDALAAELRQLRADSSKTPVDAVTRAELNQLVELIREVDRKRETDRRVILEEIENLGKTFKTMNQRRQDTGPPPAPAPAYDEMAKHTVRQGETLWDIVRAYNEEFKKQGKRTSLKLVQDANPNVKPETMRVGQEIIVPLVPD